MSIVLLIQIMLCSLVYNKSLWTFYLSLLNIIYIKYIRIPTYLKKRNNNILIITYQTNNSSNDMTGLTFSTLNKNYKDQKLENTTVVNCIYGLESYFDFWIKSVHFLVFCGTIKLNTLVWYRKNWMNKIFWIFSQFLVKIYH